MARIVILTHNFDAFRHRNYLIHPLFEHWVLWGHKVAVVRGMPPEVNADKVDIAVLHVDCSVVPAEYVEFASRFPVVVNGASLDIRKQTISRLLVKQGDGWQGRVIVKSDLNCGGVPELRHNRIAAQSGKPLVHPVRPIYPKYAVFRTPGDVPQEVWTNPDLVVERFVPERDERGFWMRTWVFFGDSGRCNRHCSPNRIVKAEEIIFREPAPVPDELREERKRLGFDFGKFDFVMSENRAILLDANRTPGGNPTLSEEFARGAEELAKGIDAFLESAHAAR